MISLPRSHKRILLAAVIAAVTLGCASVRGLPNPAVRRGWRPLLVGYLANSSIYSPAPFYVKRLLTSGSAARLDQVNYASASVGNGRCSLADPVADLGTTYNAENSVDGKADEPGSGFRGYFHQLEELKHRYPQLKILISLEGSPKDFAVDARPENRAAFLALLRKANLLQ